MPHTPPKFSASMKSLWKIEILVLYPAGRHVVKKPQWWSRTTLRRGESPRSKARSPGFPRLHRGGRPHGPGVIPLRMLQIVVNGEERAVPEGTTVAGLLADLGLEEQHVAVEANREIVPRAEHAARALADGDALEIVTFVGGG